MNLKLKLFISLLFLQSLNCSSQNDQSYQSDDLILDLKDTGKKIENYISFYTSKFDYETIKAISGEKTDIKVEKLIINGDSLAAEAINTRGQSTLYFRRKSYTFKLKSQASFHHGEKTESLKKFFVLSLSMDKYYSHNRLAFEMMKVSKLFNLFYTFCELRINGQSEGVYLVVERPEDWAMKKKDSPMIIRRGYDQKIDKIETDKKIERKEIIKYNGYFEQIYRSLNKYEGEELYKALSTWLDMDIYMKWIAFNFLVRNADYTDEVFFYIDPDINKFRIIPWDYDDLFAINPHEGIIKNKKIPGDRLIFSTEDLLDKKIAADPYLYKMYLIQLRDVLDKLSIPVLKRIFENTFAELYPYYSNIEIINKSKFDNYKDASLENLRKNMMSLYGSLFNTRIRCLNYLDSKNQ